MNWLLAPGAVALLTLAACGGSSGSADRGDKAADALFALELDDGGLSLTSPNFEDGEALPSRFSCDSTSISPALTIAGVPEGTVELAIVMDDPEAVPRTYVHWIVAKLPPDTTSLAEDFVPEGAEAARNSAGGARYDAVCPPRDRAGATYRISLYALDEATDDDFEGALATDALEEIAERATARTTLTATYSRAE